MVKHRSPKPQLGVQVSLPLLRKQIEFYLVCFFLFIGKAGLCQILFFEF